MSSPPTRLTREQLYARVWQTPMIRLAAEYGLSDNGLRKICRRFNVPCPPAGRWAKKAAGHRVKAAPLPPAKPGIPTEIIVSPTPIGTGELRGRIEAQARSLGPIAISDRLARPMR